MHPAGTVEFGRNIGIELGWILKYFGIDYPVLLVEHQIEHIVFIAFFAFGEQALREEGIVLGFDVKTDGEISTGEVIIDPAQEFDIVFFTVEQQTVVVDAAPALDIAVELAVGTIAAIVAGIALIEGIIGYETFREVRRKFLDGRHQGQPGCCYYE